MEEFQLRPYREGDEHSINKGFNQVFGLQRTLEEWRWKFQPDVDGCRIMVAVDSEDKVVAHFSAILIRALVDGRILQGGQSVDVFCLRRPDAIRQKVYLKTVQEFYRRYGAPDRLAFLFGFPGERHLKLGQLRLQYSTPMPVPMWQRSVAARRVWWPRYEVRNGFDSAAMDQLWRRSANRYPVCVVRESEWVERRYLSRPNNKYSHLTVWRKGLMQAWAVFQIARDAAQWIDLVWDGREPQALITLDNEIARIARSKGAKGVEMWLSGDEPVANILRSSGWERVEHPQQLHMTSVLFDSTLDRADLIRRFYLTMGDSDLV